jgi:hypothetical protein
MKVIYMTAFSFVDIRNQQIGLEPGVPSEQTAREQERQSFASGQVIGRRRPPAPL